MKQASELSYPEARDVVRLPTQGHLFFHRSLAEGFSWGINAAGRPRGRERCPQVRACPPKPPGLPAVETMAEGTPRVSVSLQCAVWEHSPERRRDFAAEGEDGDMQREVG